MLLPLGVVYFLVRIAGKYTGAFTGCMITGKSRLVRNYLGLALIPQAGVAIGLAELGARTLGGEMGSTLRTVILASSVLYELIGPACAKLSLALSHSYDKDSVDEKVTQPKDEDKIVVNLLIERIRKIQNELPRHEPAVVTQPVNNNNNTRTWRMRPFFQHFKSNNTHY